MLSAARTKSLPEFRSFVGEVRRPPEKPHRKLVIVMRYIHLTMKHSRIVVYGRVSTADQSHESQLCEVKEYCLRRWGAAVTTTITDTASGAKTSRQGFDQLMKLVRRGRVDVIVCNKLDRH